MTDRKAERSSGLADHVAAELRETAALAERVADSLAAPIAELARRVASTLEAGNKLLFCGNGGSAADAQHLAAEYVIRYRRQRRSLPALALTTDTSALTAAGNDLGFERIFARQVQGLAGAGDLLILHSTSGASANLVEAARTARGLGVKTAALLARDGGELKGEVDLAIVVPTESTARAQEMHLAIGHLVAEWVDRVWSDSNPEDG
ncbi:MAG: SIS domain-containing protein [Gemmatimonadetes bacterium]|uniref:Phosphoheptose isomerase n=1 Tax=Candidatus Kutchimonas denitrificans TaxID=3056748 RepID=A0AAE5C914_9BACT|nr:SIS domain-containing protein [Gemmatimonadota bacterium]NIR75016.1 SIS domain-containing protein [Candidatus Kutchimonas denitrificans]NIS01599.1 SIS domain-containing protein [Gemmatimonadota bacterium]NIT67337.1 SIS domain-containing protein [Gemmatimonadota bacterium]NIU52700.1 SIS domain-containing protein [Gemmatimonadota bacterium]